MLGISNQKVSRIRYVFVLELACYRVCYIRDNVKYLYSIKIIHINLSLYNFLHHAYKGIKIPFNTFFKKSVAMLLEINQFFSFCLILDKCW